MSEDEKEAKIDDILKRAKAWAKHCRWAEDKASWLHLRAEFKKRLLPLPLLELCESEWSDDAILSVLQDIRRPPHSPVIVEPVQPIEPIPPSEKSTDDQYGISEYSRFRKELADAKLKEAEADLLEEIKKELQGRKK